MSLPLNQNSAIFRPIQLGSKRCKNRIELAPMGCFLTQIGGRVGPEFLEYVKPFAEGGAGILTMGVSSVDRTARDGGGRVLFLGDRSYVHDLSLIADLVHLKDALVSVELAHSRYMMSPPDLVVNKTSLEDIEDIFRLFADAADRCVDAGFDMIMIHGGHGNVPAMFFSPLHNRRKDKYGGSFEGRCRFAEDLLDAIRARVGNQLAIEYRISAEELLPGTATMEETIEFTKRIQDRIDLIHVSRSLLEEDELLPRMFPPTYLPRAINLDAAIAFKQALDIPVNVVAGFDLEHAEEAVSAGQVDMVAMGRTLLADPHCVEKARQGKADTIRPCVRCNSCIHSTHSCFKPVRCAVNARLGREFLYPERDLAPVSKKVCVVGGGPAGLEAARTAAARGHRVVLLEKSGKLGGALHMASAADFKADMKKYLDWSIRSVTEDARIEVRLNCPATAEAIAAEAPDALIVAVGAKPILLNMPSDAAGKTVWVGDVELGRKEVGHRVVIAGAGFTGLEMALTLARKGKEVTVIDLLPKEKIGADGITISMICLKQLLAEAGVRFRCEVRLEDVNAEGAVISTADGARETLPCDSVVLSLGVRPDRETAEALAAAVPESYIVGDSSFRGGTLWKATQAAYDAAMRL